MLKPITNLYRTAISLNGLWNFQVVQNDFEPVKPLNKPLLIGVPSSYNELYTDPFIRDHVGLVVYERTLSIPKALTKGELRIRVGAAGNRAKSYIEGQLLSIHNGGFLPFDFGIPKPFYDKETLRLTIVLDNRLDFETLPIGVVVSDSGVDKQQINHDFANLTGIHRDVFLYSVPKERIEDIIIKTHGHNLQASIHYQINTTAISTLIKIYDPSGAVAAEGKGTSGTLLIHHPKLWDIGQGNLYTFEVRTAEDLYTEKFGIRDIEVKEGQFLLNGKPVYFKGFGMHEDHVTIGKGSISALNIRDFELLKWINANSFRTSHYPYAEEMYQLADEMGILVIDEIPAVGLNFWSSRAVFTEGTVDQKTLKVHQTQLTELIQRDKNHPSVVMISVANEANTQEGGAYAYFSEVFKHVRTLTDLPIMIVEWVGANDNKVAQLADVIGLNRYIAWYTDFTDLSVIAKKLTAELTNYHEKFKKPILLSEFGADTIAGLHQLPSVAFSEEFQVEFIAEYQKTIHQLPFVIGEHVWNFADFLTKPGLQRFHGNKKGVFTRDRQPKMAAHWLRKTWE